MITSGRSTVSLPERTTAAASACAAAVVAGVASAVTGPMTFPAAGALGVVAVAAWRPASAVYIYVATLPFIAGIDRDALIPMMRPNEALLALLVAGALSGGYLRLLSGRTPRITLSRIDLTVAAFFLFATVWPITVILLRGTLPAQSEVLATLPVCKLLGLFLLARVTLTTQKQVLWLLRIIVGGATGLAVIAILQTLSFGPVLTMLAMIDPEAHYMDERGWATLASPIATGDYLLIGLALLVTAAVRGLVDRRFQIVAGILLLGGLLAAGQFSTWLGAVIGAVLLLWFEPRTRSSTLRMAPLFAVAALVGSPAVLTRLEDFSGGSSPQSWLVRWDNLSHLYLPVMREHARFLLGVSPDSVLIPPDTWREEIYLESGYLQFLWIGGVPLVLAFIVLSRVVLIEARRTSTVVGAVGACAAGVFIAWSAFLVLLIFDPHLFMRGPGDLFFTLIGVVSGTALNKGEDHGTS